MPLLTTISKSRLHVSGMSEFSGEIQVFHAFGETWRFYSCHLEPRKQCCESGRLSDGLTAPAALRMDKLILMNPHIRENLNRKLKHENKLTSLCWVCCPPGERAVKNRFSSMLTSGSRTESGWIMFFYVRSSFYKSLSLREFEVWGLNIRNHSLHTGCLRNYRKSVL